uniref:Truncated vpu protein n=1 Tax=Human immunodeficiency virus type 1 TaxID=11676 RepID=A0A0H3YCN2_HV1|nr:truncated vpu protein [Human immunodeficiency virus 1]
MLVRLSASVGYTLEIRALIVALIIAIVV